MKKIAIGLSGGIDSTATLIRLLDQNYELIGVTLKLIDDKDEDGKCCSIKDLYDAKSICNQFNIKHYTINAKQDFKEKVIDYFIDEYLQAKTPNPCTLCNAKVRFEYIRKFSEKLNCDFFATGHYAILEQKGSEIILKKAYDQTKDQSYFLSQISPNLLKNCLFPLGKTTKEENINLLKERNISIYKKKESFDICFVAGKNYAQFIKEKRPNQEIKEGDIINEKGEKVGTHKGLIHYTIGQRRGINISHKNAIYVKELDAKNNQLIIGDKPSKDRIQINQMNWFKEYNPEEIYLIKVRVRHTGEKGRIQKLNEDTYEILFENEIFSSTPGQIAVGYLEDQVIFSGIII